MLVNGKIADGCRAPMTLCARPHRLSEHQSKKQDDGSVCSSSIPKHTFQRRRGGSLEHSKFLTDDLTRREHLLHLLDSASACFVLLGFGIPDDEFFLMSKG